MNEDAKCTKNNDGTKCKVTAPCNCGGTASSPDVAVVGDICDGDSL